jgi:hypothetical protein
MKNLIILSFIILVAACNPCKQVAKHPECFMPDTVKIHDKEIHYETEYVIKDSVSYDTLPGQIIEKTIFQTVLKHKIDTIYTSESVSKINPINQQLADENKVISVENAMLKDSLKTRNKIILSLGILVLLSLLYIGYKVFR